MADTIERMDILFELIADVAPFLGGLLGSPLAGSVISFLAREFKIDAQDLDEALDKISDFLKEIPENIVKIKEISDKFEVLLDDVFKNN